MELLLPRRRFLHAVAGAAGAAAMGSLAVAQQPAPAPAPAPARKRKLKKAVHLGMVAGNASGADKLQLLKEPGFDGVEIDGPSDIDHDALQKALDATGLVVADVIDSVHWSATLSDPDPAVRAKGVAGLEAALRDAKRHNCTEALLVPAVVNAAVSYPDAYARSQAEIRKALPLAAELQVHINVENVWNGFLLSPLEAARYVDEIGSPWVGWHFDVGNVIRYGWPEQWIRALGKRGRNRHIKEYSRKKADAAGTWKGFEVELLEGDCGWPAVMKALDDVGYEGFGIAEIPGGDRARLKEIAARMD